MGTPTAEVDSLNDGIAERAAKMLADGVAWPVSGGR
jgi:hypothetical protein